MKKTISSYYNHTKILYRSLYEYFSELSNTLMKQRKSRVDKSLKRVWICQISTTLHGLNVAIWKMTNVEELIIYKLNLKNI